MRWIACVLALLGVGCKDRGSKPDNSASPAPTTSTISAQRAAKSEATKTLYRWLLAESPGERAALLYRQDLNESDFLLASPTVYRNTGAVTMDGCGPRPIDGSCQMHVERSPGEPSIFWMRKTEDGYRIDWRASYMVNPMSMAAFQAKMPTAPTVWRLNAQLDTYFNYEFMNQQASYYSFRLFELGQEIGGIHAYGKKGDPDAEAMFSALSSGRARNVTVAIAYPASKRSNEILKLVAFYGDDFVQTARESEAIAAAIKANVRQK